MPDVRFAGAILTVGGDYKPGDLPPEGYLDWHEWAEIQWKSGLRQVECGRCGRWRFPQELSGSMDEFKATDRRGNPVSIKTPVCTTCLPQAQANTDQGTAIK